MIVPVPVTLPTLKARERRPGSEKVQLHLDHGGQGGGVMGLHMFVCVHECLFGGAFYQKKGW